MGILVLKSVLKMRRIFNKKLPSIVSDRESGFGLLETIIALVTLGICLAYAMPMFLVSKVINTRTQIRTGGSVVAQRFFDNIRSSSLLALPTNDGKNSPLPMNPVQMPVNASAPTADELLLTQVMGRQYQVKLTYCEDISTTDPTACSPTLRKVKIEVFYRASTTNPQPIYTMSSTFTHFQ